MIWQSSIVENHIHAKEPGNMWRADNGHWLVLLPGGCVHDIHGPSSDGTPWIVTGDAPYFTVSPSINCQIVGGDFENCKGWHGYLTDGVLSDDYEGRTY